MRTTQNNINILNKQNVAENGLNTQITNDNSNKFTFLPTANEKSNNFKTSVSKYLNNSDNTINFVNTVDKIIKDKNYNVLMDDTITNKLGDSVNAKITTLDNGEVEIKINPNSERAGEFLLMHEVTHAIETDSMKNLILDYAGKNTEFNTALESLKQAYGTEDVSPEVVADISGQLFGNQEFISNLSIKEPNVFKKLYNKIIEIANKITGNSKESLFIKDLKNKWEEAYRTQNNNLNKTTYSIQNNADGSKYVNVDTNQDIFNGKSLSEQTKIAKQYILDTFRQNGIDVGNENISVTSRTANEYTHPKKQNSKYVASSKMKASTELDNLLNIAEYSHSDPDDGRHIIAKDGWDYYKVNFKVGNQSFEGLVNIGKNGNVKTLYDITRIKKTSRVGSDNKSLTTNVTSSYVDNIPQSINNVNTDTSSTKYSMQENQNNTQNVKDNKWQEHLEKNYKSTGTKTNFSEIRLKGALPTAKQTDNITKQYSMPRTIPQDPTKESSYDNKKTKKEIKENLLIDMDITVEDISNGKDISSIDISRTDPIRLNEKIFGYQTGKKINDATINRTKHNEAERTRFLNSERQGIKDLGIKPRSKESAAVQKYGEKQYVNDSGEVFKYGDYELSIDFPNVDTQNKIKNAAKVLRNKYDQYIDQINNSITAMGYNPIPKRNDYMRHFMEINDKLSQWGVPLNADSLNNDVLPTDINGLTDEFKPGKNWFASAQARTGLKTTYDAITGIDGYLDGASNLIYHTEDIQRYRALSKMIRETYGQTHGFDNLADMSETEVRQRLQDISENKLSKYAAWLDEQANALAGKKGKIDRGVEDLLGRRIYAVLDTAKKQVGSNMTGYNVRSALTNFASVVQAVPKTNKLAFVKGTISTVQNIFNNDGLINKSDFLTNRFGSDSLSKKLWQKTSSAGQIFMSGTDYLTANQIWRSKYFENLQKGQTEAQAIKNADDFASRIMGDRSKGSTASIFNSKTLGLLTQFQLEVNNQWSSLIHDNKMDIKSGNKKVSSLIFQLGQLAGLSHLFNNLTKSLTGSDVMLDPIGLLKKLFDDDEKDFEAKVTDVSAEIFKNLPFTSILNGGRIPLMEAFKGGETLTKKLSGGTDKYGNEIKWEDVKNDMISSAFYWVLPTGYGQINKTTKGLSMYNGKLPTAGSYTNSGNLRFTADESTSGKIKSALFGQYSSKSAQDYIDSGFKTISKNHIQEMKDLNMNSTEYRNYRQNISEISKTTNDKGQYKYVDKSGNIYWYDKNNNIVYNEDNSISNKKITELNKISKNDQIIKYINSLNYSNEIKNKMVNYELGKSDEITDEYGYIKYKNSSNKVYWYDRNNNVLYNSNYKEVKDFNINEYNKVSNKIDIKDYEKYSSYDEMKYANSNPEKYSLISSITDYDSYQKYQDDIEEIRNKYSGNVNSKERKKKVFEYINNLSLSKAQKLILFNQLGGYSIKNNRREVHSYINSLNLSKFDKCVMAKNLGYTEYDDYIIKYIMNENISRAEKEVKLTSLGFTIKNNKVYK